MFDHRTAKALQEHRFHPVTHQAGWRTGATPLRSRIPAQGAAVVSTTSKPAPLVGSRFGFSIRARLRRAATKGTLCIAVFALTLSACGDRYGAAAGLTAVNAPANFAVVSEFPGGSWTPFDDRGLVSPLDSALRRYRPYPD